MEIKNDFRAIYNPYTKELLVSYGASLIFRQFDEMEEWEVIRYNNDGVSPYYLHVQIDYDECFQLLFYPRVEGSSDLNESLGSYYMTEQTEEEHPNNIRIVHTDREWDLELVSFLGATLSQLKSFKKINYE